jgi:hypothetical protein
MNRSLRSVALFLFAIASLACAQKPAATTASDRIMLGRLASGASVSFVPAGSGTWGIEISGNSAPRIAQPKPAQIEVFKSEQDVEDLAAPYQSVQKETAAVVAKAKVSAKGGAAFAIEDRWTLSGEVLSLSRKVTVIGAEDQAGFYSAIKLATGPTVGWPDLDYMAPGVIYGDPTYDGDTSIGGVFNYRLKRLSIREDSLNAPLFALSFRDGHTAAVMDKAPRGDTTWAETTSPATTPVIDEQMKVGALGAREIPNGGVEFGFWFPGTTSEIPRSFQNTTTAPAPIVRRRYHPVRAGFAQSYEIGFRFGQNESFLDLERNAWRWAWETLKPPVMHLDIDVVRRAVVDHLDDHVLTVDNRAGIPFLWDSVTGKPGSRRTPMYTASGAVIPPTPYPQELGVQGNGELAAWAKTVGIDLDPSFDEIWRWPKVLMGFVSKGVEAADELLREGDRDQSARGQKMRKDGLAIIDSFIRLDPMSPPGGQGFDIHTGKPVSEPADHVFLRAPSEGMRSLMQAYIREKRAGHDHPEWLAWCRQFADWLIMQQRPDGSFPRSWKDGTGEVNEASGSSTYNPVPLLVRLNQVTGDQRYLDAAIRAADYVWSDFGSHGVFVGGATDNPNITDKEAGMLSMEAFLSLYESTKEPRWLDRAKVAGNYTETWIWIWNVPMAIGADDAKLHWKRGVSTVGLQGITARGPGGGDEYLDWAVPDYARLYKYTNDSHYLDVTRILLFDTKSMLALPGRTYDLLGPGWQQENWGLGPGRRGFGSHRTWLPWVSVNHLHGITGLEEFDPVLFQQLIKEN